LIKCYYISLDDRHSQYYIENFYPTYYRKKGKNCILCDTNHLRKHNKRRLSNKQGVTIGCVIHGELPLRIKVLFEKKAELQQAKSGAEDAVKYQAIKLASPTVVLCSKFERFTRRIIDSFEESIFTFIHRANRGR
jgi:hypothetical protein